MITLKQYLIETMSQVAPHNWEYTDNSDARATFNVGDVEYFVLFGSDEDTPTKWDIVFDINNRPTTDEKYSTSNTGNASLVFSTVLQLVTEFVKLYPNVHTITFTAKEQSRQKFYDRWAPLVARRIGNWNIRILQRGIKKYILTKPIS